MDLDNRQRYLISDVSHFHITHFFIQNEAKSELVGRWIHLKKEQETRQNVFLQLKNYAKFSKVIKYYT